MTEWKIITAFLIIFPVAYFLLLARVKVSNVILEAFKRLQWYAQNHTRGCVVPALIIAGPSPCFSPRKPCFATLTEIPILQALLERGMHNGPALALLPSGPALALPSLLVIRSVVQRKKPPSLWRS